MNKNIRKLPLIVTATIILLLAGCWFPEDFEANVTIHKDGSYTFTYDGALTYALARAAAKDGSLSREDDAYLEKEAEKWRKEPDYKKVEYMGKGRFKVLVKHSGKAGEPYFFMKDKMVRFFYIVPQQDGTIKITAKKFSKNEMDQIKSIGARINGSLSVSVERGVKVIKNNAPSKPQVFGLFGDYEWEIDSFDATPFILVQPSP